MNHPAARWTPLLLVTSALLGCGTSDDGTATAEGTPDAAAEGGPETHAPLNFADIGQPVTLDERFYRSEGPLWDPAKSVLYFTDISAVTGGAIYRLTLPGSIDTLLAPDGNANGLALDTDGTLIGAGHVAGTLFRMSNGALQTLAPCPTSATASCFEGQPLNAPNDLVTRSDGTIYFTDPNFGNELEGFPAETRPLADREGVYRLTGDGTVHLEDVGTPGPNGISLSPDEKTLYVSYTLDGVVAKFDVAADGSLANRQTFAGGTLLADGMCGDAGGNLYVGTADGLAVFSSAGERLGTIVPAHKAVTNCAFGGTDQKTLFITSHTSFPAAAGDAALAKIDGMPIPGIAGRN